MVIDCSGNQQGLDFAYFLVKPTGMVMLKSTTHDSNPINLSKFVVNEVQLVCSRCGPFDAALRILERKVVNVKTLITHRFGLDDGVKALQLKGETDVLKIIIKCN